MTISGQVLLKNTFWSLFERGGYMVTLFITNIVLARILDPADFGQIGIVMFFIAMANIFVEGGFGGALIRMNIVTDRHYSTFFITNFIISIIVYLMILIVAKPISIYYNDPSLFLILVVSSLVIIINSFNFVQSNKLIRSINFKKKSIFALISLCSASIFSIVAAVFGAKIWSLVIFQITNSLIFSLILWRSDQPFNQPIFDKKIFIDLWGFGINTTLSSLLDTIFDNIYQLIFAKMFSINQVGTYYQAKRLQFIPFGVLQSLTHGVIYSFISKYNHDIHVLQMWYMRIFKYFLIIASTFCSILFLYADEIVLQLLGNKWIDSIWFMKVLSIGSLFYFISSYSRMIFKILNRTDLILKLEVFKKVILSITIIFGMINHNLSWLMYGLVLTNIIFGIIFFALSLHFIESKFSSHWIEPCVIIIFFIIGGTTEIFVKEALQAMGCFSFISIIIYLFLMFSLFHFSKILTISEIKNFRTNINIL